MDKIDITEITEKQRDIFQKNLVFSVPENAQLVESKHEQIVRGACSVFFKKGYHPTTIREIAKASGMSVGQLYHYVSSKDDVLFLVHKHLYKIWYTHLENAGMDKIDDPLDRLKTALNFTIRFVNENKKMFQFTYSESKYLGDKHLRAVLEMDRDNVISFWDKLIRDVKKKALNESELYFSARMVPFLTAFLALRGWSFDAKHSEPEENISNTIKFILNGLGITKDA